MYISLYARMLSHFSCVQLCMTLWTTAHQAPLSMRILQARILESVAMPFSRESSQHRDRTHVSYVSCVSKQIFTTSATWEAPYVCMPVPIFKLALFY